MVPWRTEAIEGEGYGFLFLNMGLAGFADKYHLYRKLTIPDENRQVLALAHTVQREPEGPRSCFMFVRK